MAIGWIAYCAIRSVDRYDVEILISLDLVSGGYALASALQLSGPIAMRILVAVIVLFFVTSAGARSC